MTTDKTSFAYVTEKLGPVDPETKLIAKEVFDAAKAAGHAPWYMWGYDNNAGNVEHHSGNALDFMVKSKEHGDWIRDYLWANRSRLRLRHVIWQQHITSAFTQPGVVRKMEDRGDSTQNHMDHVHVLFNAGRYQPKNNVSVPPRKTATEVAQEIIKGDGNWGDGDTRRHLLQKAGYDYNAVQAEVNRLLKVKPKPNRKNLATLVAEVRAGKWGNGDERVRRLKQAGYDPKVVQNAVNRNY